MVAELGLRARSLDFTPLAPNSRTMATPTVAEVPLDPPMRTYGNASMRDYVQMGAAGALVIQAVVVVGGRVAQGIYNKMAKRPKLLYDEHGNLLDFPIDRLPRTQ